MRTSGFKLLAAFSLTLCLCVSGTAAWAQEGDDVDPVKDVAGLLVPDSSSPGKGVLYTTSHEEKDVLDLLRATAIGPDQYRATINGVSIQFLVLRAILPGFYLPPGDLICQTGTVKVYRNSTCTTTITGGSSGCSPYTNGNHATLSYNPTKKCKRGTGYCIEVNRVLWTRNIYFDNQCSPSQFLGSQHGYDFMCN